MSLANKRLPVAPAVIRFLSATAGKQQMQKGGVSDPRNKALMKMFNLIDVGERAGSGVPGIFMTWNDAGFTSPLVEETFEPDRTRITLFFEEADFFVKTTEKTTEKTQNLVKNS